ncbi:hypothetical protein Barb7_03079 [Bacteroidales bacterium Barb7]|nr:hypothetical protein Barb7_03079 [Bacteroidales bacterium Barb7]
MARGLSFAAAEGKRSSSKPAMNTLQNSKPLAEWTVIRVTQSVCSAVFLS